MATVLFVHGTGVRKASYLSTFVVVKNAFQAHHLNHALEPCLWGDDLGSRRPSLSLPDPIAPRTSAAVTRQQDIARWRLLYGDPVFELRLLKNRPHKPRPMLPGSPRPDHALWARIAGYRVSSRVEQFLCEWQLGEYWEAAWHYVVEEGTAKDVLDSSPDDIGEPGQAIARAVVAALLMYAIEEERPILDAPHRDELVQMLMEDWGADVAGVGVFLLLATLEGHSAAVYAVAVTPDGRRAISGSYDRTLKVWNLEDGALVATLGAHADPVLLPGGDDYGDCVRDPVCPCVARLATGRGGLARAPRFRQ
jgi:hypothetical protein